MPVTDPKYWTWHNYFFDMVDVIKKKSKDMNTKIGCIIVGPDHEVRATGYNSFPRGIRDDLLERQERPEKYFWFEHAERNAIYNAARVGVSLKGCVLYTQCLPCMDCARGIVQAGIKSVVVDQSQADLLKKSHEKGQIDWDEHMERTLQLFDEAGVILYEHQRFKKDDQT